MRIALGYRHYSTAAGFHIERAFRAIGHEVVYVGLPSNERPGYDGTARIGEILSRQPTRPDLFLWVDSAGRYFPRGIADLPLPTACYLIDTHLGTWRDKVALFFDAVFVAQHDCVDHLKQVVRHDHVYWLPLAAAADVHARQDSPRIYEVGFVGNIARAHRGTDRARRLQLISRYFRTNDFYRPYEPKEVGQIYSQSHIVFNTSIAGDVTMRIFEGTACGALVLTDSTTNALEQLFEIGKEIVIYSDDDDLLGKIRYYLDNEDKLTQIAEAGYRRSISQHTYDHRVGTIISKIAGSDFKQASPMRIADNLTRFAARREILTHLHMIGPLIDETKAAGYHIAHRTLSVFPCLFRRLLV